MLKAILEHFSVGHGFVFYCVHIGDFWLNMHFFVVHRLYKTRWTKC
jgi:hypothetical protein